MVTEVLKPIALRPVVTSFLVNAESSTGVSAHLHVETMVFVSRDIWTTLATVKVYFTLADVARASESRPPAPSLLMKCPEVTSKLGSCTPEWLPQKISQVSSAASCLRSAERWCWQTRLVVAVVGRSKNPALWNTAGGVPTTVGSRFFLRMVSWPRAVLSTSKACSK